MSLRAINNHFKYSECRAEQREILPETFRVPHHQEDERNRKRRGMERLEQLKKKKTRQIENSKCDSTPGSSPPNGAPLQSMPGINGRSTIQEELGKNGTAAGSDVQSREMSAIRLGMPLTTNVLHSLGYYPALPVIDGDFTPPTSPGYMQPTKILDGSTGLSGMLRVYPATITDAQVAQARLHRTIQRPLGRTQSAPLPLGHPMLQPQAILLSPQQNEQYAREKRLCEQQQHNLLKQI
ncbi:hypothetical protein HNY73_003638 [Argiope bruennichi]|uniref:Uncharacterized protein n=1 Tax=Argiope bruennichi TaxID=94029 RepID=A0A8T0FLA1_ARGBR|nr:hypothetical protein HNY73_003638 [Argiope bruennichi]